MHALDSVHSINDRPHRTTRSWGAVSDEVLLRLAPSKRSRRVDEIHTKRVIEEVSQLKPVCLQ